VETPTPEAAARDAIRHWSRLPELAEFAAQRHGFGDSNGGFGVNYPGDLDDHDRATGARIPEGFVRVYGFWGPPGGYEVLVPELTYLGALVAEFSAAGHTKEAARVHSLLLAATGMGAVQASALFRSLDAQHPGVEVWPDPDAPDASAAYFWVVSRFGEGKVRNLAYVRVRNGRLERRTYDESGDDLWVPAE